MTLSYVVTAAAMIAVPGPDVLLLSSRALQRGARPALRTLAGTVTGYAVLTAVVAAGLGAVLAQRGEVLTALRVAAVLYLLHLALGAWRTAGVAVPAATGSARGDWRDGLLTAALNPKGLLFFVALLPPFVDPGRPAVPQLLLLGLVFCALATVEYGGVVAATLAARRRLDLQRRGVGRTSAVVLVAAAAFIASGAHA